MAAAPQIEMIGATMPGKSRYPWGAGERRLVVLVGGTVYPLFRTKPTLRNYGKRGMPVYCGGEESLVLWPVPDGHYPIGRIVGPELPWMECSLEHFAAIGWH